MIDASIPLQSKGIAIRPMAQSLGEAMQMRGIAQQNDVQTLAIQKARREQEAQDAFRRLVQQSGGDYEQAIAGLQAEGYGDLALDVRKSLFEQRKQLADVLETETKTASANMTQATQLLQGATDPMSYSRVLPRVRKLAGPELAAQIPDQYDPAFVASAVQWGMTAAEKASMRNAAVAEANQAIAAAKDGREAVQFYTGAGSKWLSTVDSQEEWEQALLGLKELGATPDVLAQFPAQYSPDAVQQVKALSMTPEEREQLRISEMQANTTRAAASEARRHNLAMEARPVDDRLVQVMGPGGQPIWVPEHDAIGMPAAQAPRAVTGAERQSLAYYNRARQATEDITPLEDDVAKMGLGAQSRLQYAPNFMQSQTGQQYRQAQRAFTEARLRKESGAAIPAGEYENDAKTYFAQPGDTPKTLEQKRAARAKVLEGLGYAAGKAYEEFYGEPLMKIGATAATIKTNPFKK